MTTAQPTLELAGITNAATTYSFRGETRGWALCTVNDQTGELIITSDWGSWSYQWSPQPSHLGHATLTHFIGDRAGPDYIADKLLGRRGSYVFSAPETTKHLRKRLCEVRWKDGKEQNARLLDWGDDDDYRDGLAAIRNDGGYSHDHSLIRTPTERWKAGDPTEQWRYYLTASQARELWDELGDLESEIHPGEDDAARQVYIDRFTRIDNHEILSEEPWEDTQTVESRDSKILRGTILPALVIACRDHAAATPAYVDLRADWEAKCRVKAEADARARGANPDGSNP
jgi:hypothetical protein